MEMRTTSSSPPPPSASPPPPSSSSSAFPPNGVRFISLNDVFSEKIFAKASLPALLGRAADIPAGTDRTSPSFAALTVSRKHAELRWDESAGLLLLRDVGSSSGTFVNGERLSGPGEASEYRVLRHKDIVQLGQKYSHGGLKEDDVKFIVQLENDDIPEDATMVVQKVLERIIPGDGTVAIPLPPTGSPSQLDLETRYTQSTKSSSEEGSVSGKSSPGMSRSQRFNSLGAAATLRQGSLSSGGSGGSNNTTPFSTTPSSSSSFSIRHSVSEAILNSLLPQSLFQSPVTGALLDGANSVTFFQSFEPGSSVIARAANGEIAIAPTKDSPLKLLSSLIFSPQDKSDAVTPRKPSNESAGSSGGMSRKLKNMMKRASALSLGVRKSVSKETLDSLAGMESATIMTSEDGEDMIAVPTLLQLNFGDVFLDQEISSNLFSSVYKGTLVKLMPVHQQRLQGSNEVWVKTINDDVHDDSFKKELAILWSVNLHANCCTMVGYSQSPPSIVFKNYSGTLSEIIKAQSFQFSPKHLFMIAVDISQGLACLHSLEVIHLDLRSENVYLQLDGTSAKAAIGEFGVAQPQGDLAVFNESLVDRLNGFPGFAAPELLHAWKNKSELLLRTKIDIYSFALILYHMLTREKPWGEGVDHESIVDNVLNRNRPSVPPHIRLLKDVWTPILLDLMNITWDHDPQERPSSAAISSRLNFLMEKLSQ